MEELAAILGEELALPRIEPRGKKNIITTKRQVHRHPPDRPRIAAPLQAHLQEGPAAADRLEHPTIPLDPIVMPIREDKQYRSWNDVQLPQSVAVVIYMMDVSGSMTDEQKEIVRIEAFWIDAWLKAQYEGVETVYIIHDAVAQEVDEHTFYHTRESGGTRISSAYNLADKIIDGPLSAGRTGTSTPSTSPTATTGATTRRTASNCCSDKLLPKLNLFGYGQVESPYGSGEFYEYVHELVGERENVVCSRIPDREAIFDSIKEFLGTGR